MKKLFLLFVLLVAVSTSNYAQDLMALLDSTSKPPTIYTERTFKSSRLINGYNVETTGENDLVFCISHRFGPISNGAYEFYGLDQSMIRLGFEYGATDRLSLGIGRSSYEKLIDGYFKYKILRQKTGAKNFPFSLTLQEGIYYKTLKWDNPDLNYPETARLFYVHELFFARKFGDTFSMQVVPVLIHRNMVKTKEEQNLVSAVGIGGVYTLNNWLSISAEYYHLLPGHTADTYSNSLAVGIEIDTGGGHLFQLHFSNSRGMTEKNFIPETNGKWEDGDIALGFNIIRVFNLK